MRETHCSAKRLEEQARFELLSLLGGRRNRALVVAVEGEVRPERFDRAMQILGARYPDLPASWIAPALWEGSDPDALLEHLLAIDLAGDVRAIQVVLSAGSDNQRLIGIAVDAARLGPAAPDMLLEDLFDLYDLPQQPFWRSDETDPPHLPDNCALPDPVDVANKIRQRRGYGAVVRKLALPPECEALSIRQLTSALLATLALYLVRTTGKTRAVLGFGASTSSNLQPRAALQPVSFEADIYDTFNILRERAEKVVAETGSRSTQFGALRSADPGAGLERHPLYQAGVIQETRIARHRNVAGLSVTPVAERRVAYATLDLTIVIGDRSEGREVEVVFASDVFDEAQADRAAHGLSVLLSSGFQASDAPVLNLPLLDADELQRIVHDWNETTQPYDHEACIHDLVARQATERPDAIAVVCEGETLTYGELDAAAGQLADRLVRLGVGPDRVVGLLATRSPRLVVALLGILKAGGAYLPLDPELPDQRLEQMLADAGSELLIFDGDREDRVSGFQGGRLRLKAAEGLEEAFFVAPQTVSSDLANVIYTSGSTGRPKGVMTSHRSLVNRLNWMQRAFLLTFDDVVLQKTNFAFDVSVWEFFWPLITGARLVLARPGGQRDPEYLAELIRREGVTVLHFVPSALAAWRRLLGTSLPTSVRLIVCSGEALPGPLGTEVARENHAELWNLYGPTEAAIDVTAHRVCSDDAHGVPIGRPIDNTQIYILDRWLNPLPVDVPGELFIAGDGLARGYIGQAELTDQRFVRCPFGSRQERMYRTGDLAKWRCDGEIEYIGRVDDQIKIRGHRVELGEIEATLLGLAEVGQAHVMAINEGEETEIVAFVVAKRGSQVTAEHLRAQVGRRLSPAMVPSVIHQVPDIPMTANGKTDRARLWSVHAEMRCGAVVSTEAQNLCRYVAKQFDLVEVSAHLSLLEIAVDSLRAVEVAGELLKIYAAPLSIIEVLAQPSLIALANALQAQQKACDVTLADALEEGEI